MSMCRLHSSISVPWKVKQTLLMNNFIIISSTLQGNKGDGVTNRRTGKKMWQPSKNMMLEKRGSRIKLKSIKLSTKVVSELTLCEVKTVSGFAWSWIVDVNLSPAVSMATHPVSWKTFERTTDPFPWTLGIKHKRTNYINRIRKRLDRREAKV